MTSSRRQFVKRAAGATIPVLSGCSAPETPADVAYEPYWSWLWAPRESTASPYGAFFSLSTDAVSRHESAFDPQTYRKYRGYLSSTKPGRFGLVRDDVTDVLMWYPNTTGSAGTLVLHGSFSRRDVRPDLQELYGNQARDRTFDRYWGSSRLDPAVGVSDGVLILGYPIEKREARAVLDATIEARRGEVDRYVESSDDFQLLVETLGSGDDVSGLTHDARAKTRAARGVFRNAVAKGHRYVFGHETSQSRYVFVFEREGDADVDAIRTWVDANDESGERLFGGYRTTSVTASGRAVLLDGTVETTEI